MSQTTGQTSATKRPTLEMLLALASFIAGVMSKLPPEKIQYFLENKTLLKRKLWEVLEIPTDLFVGLRRWWEEFYLIYFSLTVDFSNTFIPAKPTNGSYQAIFVAEGLTLDATIDALKKKFRVKGSLVYLDRRVSMNTRNPVNAYVVWVRVGDEPDVEYLGQSTRTADMEGEIGITLLERLLLDLKHFDRGNNHLDLNGLTLCTGSRRTDGFVPCVYWFIEEVEMRIGFCDVDTKDPRYGLRQVVS